MLVFNIIYYHKNIRLIAINIFAPILELIKFMQQSQEKTVVVIGAGLSGLSAAQQILKKRPNTKVIVLEAMNRVGGRTFSQQIRGAMFDFGGMWVGPHQKHVLALAQRANLQLMKQPHTGLKILQLNNTIGRYRSDIPNNVNIIGLIQMQYYIIKLNRMARTIPLECPSQCPNAVYWDSITVYSWIHSTIWFEKVRKLLEAAVRAVFGVEPSQLSMLFFLWYVHQSGSVQNLINIKNGNQEKKFVKGSNSLTLFLGQQIKNAGGEVHLGCPVESVEKLQSTGKVSYRVKTKNTSVPTIQCDHLIIAIPPVSVQRIHFIPKLSCQRQMICQKNFMGSIIKILLFYEKQFWLEKGFSAEILSDCLDNPVFNAYDDTRPKENGEVQPALVIFVNAGISRAWGNRADLVSKSIQQIKKYFGPDTPDPIQSHVQNWDQNEYTRGGPIANFGPGLLSQVEKLTKKQGNIYWAGTELAYEGQGFMDGAIQSGLRAAEEVLSEIGSPQAPEPNIPRTGAWYSRLIGGRRWLDYLF